MGWRVMPRSMWDFVTKLQGTVGTKGKEPLPLSYQITFRKLLWGYIVGKIWLRAAKKCHRMGYSTSPSHV